MDSRGNSSNIPPKYDESEIRRLADEFARKIIKFAASQADKLSTLTVGDAQLRSFLIAEREADVRAGDKRKRQSQEAPVETMSMMKSRLDLSEQATAELEYSLLLTKQLPEMRAKLDVLMKKHQSLCETTKHEIGLKVKNVDQMKTLENALAGITEQVESLCIELSNAVKRATALAPHTVPNVASGPVGGADMDLELSL